MSEEKIRVMAYSGHKGKEIPRAFVLGGKRIEVVEIRESWIEEVGDRTTKRFFKGRHPLAGADGPGAYGYDFDVPALRGGFVSAEDGTGFVHIAPGHGEDDFHLGQAHNVPVPQTVGTQMPAFGAAPSQSAFPASRAPSLMSSSGVSTRNHQRCPICLGGVNSTAGRKVAPHKGRQAMPDWMKRRMVREVLIN